MAVEIPVVIDIDKAFSDAAKRVGVAIEPLRKSVEGLTEDLGVWTSLLNGADIESDTWIIAAKNIQTISEKLAEADYQLRRYTSNEGSIKQMSIDLAELNRRWEAMGASQKFVGGSTLSADAQKMVAQYKLITADLNKQGKTLQQVAAEEERLERLRQKGIQTRRYENAILGASAKTMKTLQEQERILSERLSRARIGSGAYNKLKTDLEGVRKELAAINGETVKTESGLERLVKNSLRLVALHAAGTFVRNVREVTAEFELQKVALGSIIRDTERAEGLFRQIKAAAIESPFEIKDLVSYTKQLSAYQIETDKLFDTTMKLADVSAGLGVDMSRLVLAYGQVRAAAVLRGQELRQFTEAGIPLVDKLAEKFRELGREGTTTADVFQLISERAVPFRMIEEIFDDMTSAGGMFYKMQEKQAKTLAGQWANLKDAVSIMYDEIGNTKVVHDAMESMISGARSLMQNWRAWYNVINVVGTGLAAYLGLSKSITVYTNLMASAEAKAAAVETTREKGLRKFVTSLIGKTAAEKISAVATDLHTGAMIRAFLATNRLSKAFWQLTAAMSTNPFGILVTVVGSLVALFTTLGKKTHDVSKDIDAAEASIASFNKTTKETANLIKQYDELSKKEKLTADEARKLRDVSQELGAIFPKTAEGINKQTGALVLNIEKLKAYNIEAEKAIRKGMEAEIRENQKQIKQNQKEIDKITKENSRGWGRNKSLGLLSPILFPLSDKAMAENKDALIQLQSDNEKLIKANKELQDTLDGVTESTDNASKKTTEWQDKLIEFNSRLSHDGITTMQVISPDQIKNYSKLSDALDDIAGKYKEYAEDEKKLKSAIKDKSGTEREELQGILDRTTARKNLAKEELDYYNAFYLTQEKHSGKGYLQHIRDEINDITNAYKKFIELRKYKSEASALVDIGTFFPALKGWAPTYSNMIERLESMLSQYKGDANATRIIEQAIANIKFDNIKQNIEQKLKNLSDEIKRSETARNFYKNILDLSGDEQMSATLTMQVYGQTGDEFKDRVQKEMFGAIESVKELVDKDLYNDIVGSITIFDTKHIREEFEKLPLEIQPTFERLLSENEKYNADWISNLIKTYQKAKDYEERITDIRKREEQKRKEISESSVLSDEQKATYTEASKTKESRDVADVELEALKNTYAWTQAFKDMERVSTDTLKELIRLLDEYIEKSGADAPESLKAVRQAREQAQEQLTVRNSYRGAVDGLKNYIEAKKEASRLEKEGKKDTLEYKKAQDKARDALKDTDVAIQAIGESFNTLSSIVSSVSDILDLDELSDGKAVLSGIATGISLIGTALVFVNAVMTMLEANPVVLAISAVIAAIASVSSVISNLKTARLDRQIKTQQEHLDALAYSYDRLGKAMEKSFGSDYIYNYNKQIEILAAQQAAYNEQARLEREKGKKADEDKIKDYENSARDAADQIADMRTQLSEFFSGTDLTSAAEDFANAWIEAYKEFGSTTDAMSEKFNEMIENMINKSLAAKIMQEMLQPIFDQIDLLAKDGLLSTEDISSIAALAQERIPLINDAMTNLMTNLASAGLDVRNSTVGLKGISKEIAGASEESILALAAGINTQNFYMSYMPTISENVSAILAAMTGGVNPTTSVLTNENGDIIPSVQQMVYDHLPNVDNNISEMLRLFRSVVTTKNSSTNTAYIAIR